MLELVVEADYHIAVRPWMTKEKPTWIRNKDMTNAASDGCNLKVTANGEVYEIQMDSESEAARLARELHAMIFA